MVKLVQDSDHKIDDLTKKEEEARHNLVTQEKLCQEIGINYSKAMSESKKLENTLKT